MLLCVASAASDGGELLGGGGESRGQLHLPELHRGR